MTVYETLLEYTGIFVLYTIEVMVYFEPWDFQLWQNGFSMLRNL